MATTFDKIQLGGNIRRVITTSNANFSKLVLPANTIVKGGIGGLSAGDNVGNQSVTDVLISIVTGSSNSDQITSGTITGTGFKAAAPNTYTIPFNAVQNAISKFSFTLEPNLGGSPKGAVVTTINSETGAVISTENVAADAITFTDGETKKAIDIAVTNTSVAGNVYNTVGKAVIIRVDITTVTDKHLLYDFQAVTTAYAYYGTIDAVDFTKEIVAADVLTAVKAATPEYDTVVDNVVEGIQYTVAANKTFFIATSLPLQAITTAYGIDVIAEFEKVDTGDVAYNYVYLFKTNVTATGVDVFFDASFDPADAGLGHVDNTFVTFKNIWYTEKGPLDAKTVAAQEADLEQLKAVAYKGMQVYVAGNDTHYEYDGTDWQALRRFFAKDPIGGANDITFRDGTVQDTLEDLLYVNVNITSFTNTVNTVEKGQAIKAVTLKWAVNDSGTKPAVVKAITIDGTAVDKALRQKDFTYDDAGAVTANKTYTLKVTDNRDYVATKTTAITFLNGKYYGKTTDKSDATITNDFIQGLTKALASSRTGDFVVNAGAGEYIVFAIPASFGTPAFYVGGFEGGFDKIKTFDYTNPSGFTESYDVWASTNANLGNTTVTVK